MNDATRNALILSGANLLLYLATTTELAISWNGPGSVPVLARRIFSIIIRERKRGLVRILGTVVGGAIALSTQAVVIVAALRATESLEALGRLALYLELGLAAVWTALLLVRALVSRNQG